MRCKKGNVLKSISFISKKDLYRWNDVEDYGQRWIVEIVFSSIKRMFEEYVYSVRLENMIQEMILKSSLYNKMISIHTERKVNQR